MPKRLDPIKVTSVYLGGFTSSQLKTVIGEGNFNEREGKKILQ